MVEGAHVLEMAAEGEQNVTLLAQVTALEEEFEHVRAALWEQVEQRTPCKS